MTLLLLLFSIGLLLLAVEVIVPGGIFGTVGGLSLLAASVVASFEFGPFGGVIALLASILLSVSTLIATLWVMRHSGIGRRAFLLTEITSTSSTFAREAESLIGKPARAITILSPGGLVRVGEKSYEAFCQSGQVPAGTSLEVIGSDAFRLIVSPTPIRP